jgi:hypothetical protein
VFGAEMVAAAFLVIEVVAEEDEEACSGALNDVTDPGAVTDTARDSFGDWFQRYIIIHKYTHAYVSILKTIQI